MKIYLFYWDDNNMSRHTAKCLSYSISQIKSVTLVSSVSNSDLIIICDRNRDPFYFQFIESKRNLPSHIPQIVVSTRDDPIVLCNGFYSNLSKSIHVPGMSKGNGAKISQI